MRWWHTLGNRGRQVRLYGGHVLWLPCRHIHGCVLRLCLLQLDKLLPRHSKWLGSITPRLVPRCQSAVRRRGGVGTQIVVGAVSACSSTSVAACPAGTTVVGGGGNFVAQCAVGGGGSPCTSAERFVTTNQPIGWANGWGVTYECGTSQAYAVCAQ